jgi:hypothetical protein
VPRTAKLVVLTYYNWRAAEDEALKRQHGNISGMRAYADVCGAYADVCGRMDEALTRQHGNISGMRAYADVCGRMLTYADVWTRPSRDSTATLVVLKFYETVLKYYN